MEPKTIIIEAVGYLGSALVVVSMLMTSVMKLRVINTIGSIIFTVYALIIKSYPTALMNAALIAINIYQMLRLRTGGKSYEAVELSPDDRFLSFFLDHYGEDIAQYAPGFRDAAARADLALMTSCDGNPVGIVLGKKDGDCLELLVDYVVPAFRDFSVGSYVYVKLKEAGFARVVWRSDDPEMTEYRGKMNFVRASDGSYEKVL